MELLSLWLTPLILLPGVALLVVSTSARYGRIHDEVHHLFAHANEASPEVRHRLYLRARLFRDALVALYVCIALFSLSSLLGLLTAEWVEISQWIGIGLLVAGIGCLAFASLQLVRESMHSLEIIDDHLNLVQGPDAPSHRHG